MRGWVQKYSSFRFLASFYLSRQAKIEMFPFWQKQKAYRKTERLRVQPFRTKKRHSRQIRSLVKIDQALPSAEIGGRR